MDYIKQRLALRQWQRLNGTLSHVENHLYDAIFDLLNEGGWAMPRYLSPEMIRAYSAIENRTELKRTRDSLVKKGLITYDNGSYEIVDLTANCNGLVYADVYGSVTDLYTADDTEKTAENVDVEPLPEDAHTEDVTQSVTDLYTDMYTQPDTDMYTGMYTPEQEKKEKKQKKKEKDINININKNKTRTRARKTPTISEVLDSVQSDKLREWLTKFVEHRKKLNKPLTGYALQLIIRKLDNLSPDIGLQCEMLQQSILNAWQSVYPLKDDIVYKDAHDNSGGTCLTSEVSEIERMFMRQYAE